MVNVVVTGGGGFLGARLARRLLAAGELDLAGGGVRPIDRLTLIDQVPAPADLAADYRVAAVQGDLGQLLAAGPRPRTGPGPTAEPGPLAGSDLIFHLAAAVSGECEADFDLGMRANLRATEALLAAGRALGTRPVVVFSSSLAVFGNPPDHPLPPVVDDQTLASPQSSYGTQKLMGEYLLADYTRKGFLRGRAMRLATVSVRPAGPTRRRRGSCPASSASRSRASARSARWTRGRRWRWPRRTGPPTRCCARPPPRIRTGAGPRRSTCPRSPSRWGTWWPRWSGPRAGRDRADRLGARPRGGPAGDQLAGPVPYRPGGPARPGPGPGLRRGHRDLPGPDQGLSDTAT